MSVIYKLTVVRYDPKTNLRTGRAIRFALVFIRFMFMSGLNKDRKSVV